MKPKIVSLILCFAALVCGASIHAQEKPGQIAPAEIPMDGKWEEIDQRLIFLMVRLANLEASLDAVENTIGKITGKRTASVSAAQRAQAGNELMDRKGGAPMKWSEFYGRTAEKFFYHPVDPNTSYHTETVLAQKGPQPDNKVGGGVPASQGLPVHQRPPQFDYIYRANESAKARAEQDAAELKGQIEALLERRQRLEAEQNGLWCEVAFRAVSHYDLDKKPLYRFEPLVVEATTEARQQTEIMKASASFMRIALSVIDEAQKDQTTTFSKIKPAVSDARQSLNDAFLRLAIDVTDRQSAEGRFAMLAKRLEDVASNLSDSYEVANEGDLAKDQQRKDTFRGLLQESLVGYAQIIMALDEMAVMMRDEWKIKPDVNKPIQFVSLANVTPLPTQAPDIRPLTPPASNSSTPSPTTPQQPATPKTAGSVTALRMKNAPDAVMIDGHFYKGFRLYKPIPWKEAEAKCREMGGYLVCLETEVEQKKVAPLKGAGAFSWVGAYKKDGKFYWLNGQEVSQKFASDKYDHVCYTADGGFNFGLLTRPSDGTSANPEKPGQIVRGYICEWDE